jgi:hypothetical protein
MKTIKLLKFMAALLVCFTAGAYAAQWWPKRTHPELRRLGESVEYTTPLYRQYRNGDYVRAKAAMLEIVRHLDEYEAESARRGVEWGNTDGMWAYARLAKLEAKHGGAQGAEFMREAAARCERLKLREGQRGRWRRCDESYLRGEVDRLDVNIK